MNRSVRKESAQTAYLDLISFKEESQGFEPPKGDEGPQHRE
jgi:hypothetical protein